MKVNDFAITVSEKEGMKVNLSIAQISEVLKVINKILDNELYKLIKGL